MKIWIDTFTLRISQNVKRARRHVLRFLFCATCVLFLIPQVAAQATSPDPVYTVQPGDSLPTLSARFGVAISTLTALNNLPDPRALYPGQLLRLPPDALLVTDVPHHIALDDHLSILAQRAGVSWEALALHNRLLNPTNLVMGQPLFIPELASETVVSDVSADATLATALRHRLSYWSLRQLNPLPRYTGDTLLLPDAPPASPDLPYPITTLHLSPQPVMRGTTAVLSLTTAISATCEVVYLDFAESCYAENGTNLIAFVGLPPLLDPGSYTLTLTLNTFTNTLILPLPLRVSPGRYDYERIDLPPSRQSLLDPTKSQAERDKITRLRTLRSSERLWEYPFTWPVDASVTSYYGSRRSYGWGFNSFHAGTDFRGAIGMPVLAPASGTVVLAEPLVVRGNAILIDHGWGIVSGYWHLSRIEVAVGQEITQGMRIGAIGNTGLSTGPHLHWELWVNGSAVSPLQWVKPTLGSP